MSRLSLHTSQLPVNRYVGRRQARPRSQGGDSSIGAAGVNKKVTHPITGADVIFYGQFNGSFNLTGCVIPVEHQNGNEILDPFCLSLGAAKSLQKLVHGFWPALAPLPNGPCAVESHRALLNQLQIMIRGENPFIVAVRPFMLSYPLGANENLHR